MQVCVVVSTYMCDSVLMRVHVCEGLFEYTCLCMCGCVCMCMWEGVHV